MKQLTLIRHAKSDWHSPSKTDFERPLNKRGEKAAPLMGRRLAARDCTPDCLLSSPADRARQTAEIIAREIAYPQQRIEYAEAIYDAELETLIRVVQNLSDRNTHVILVGHNPGFSELGQWLAPEAPASLPTCGLLELDLPISSWSEAIEGCAVLRLYDYPKKEF